MVQQPPQNILPPPDQLQPNLPKHWGDAPGPRHLVLVQRNMEDDFEALYGTAAPSEPAPQPNAAQRNAQQAGAAPVAAAAEPDDLFAQLYGSTAPEELAAGAPMPSSCPVCPPRLSCALAAERHHLRRLAPLPHRFTHAAGAPVKQQHAAAPAAAPAAAAANGGAPPGVAAAAAPAAAAADEEEDEDDLMITLDENATSIEPTAHRYQYTRPTPAAAAAPAAPGGPPAVGAAPGQHMDTSDAAAPGAPAGAPRPGAGFGSQTAIGGVPRSAIPGLGGAIGGYQPAAIPGLGGAPTGPGGLPQPAVAAAAAVAAPTMRQSAFRAPQQSAQPRAGAPG